MIRPDFVNHRMAGEKFSAYRARRKTVAKAIKLYLKGRLAFKASEPVCIPGVGVDAKVDEAVLRGQYRRLTPTMLAGKPMRLGCTKGVSFRYTSVSRADARANMLDASREARATA